MVDLELDSTVGSRDGSSAVADCVSRLRKNSDCLRGFFSASIVGIRADAVGEFRLPPLESTPLPTFEVGRVFPDHG